MIKLGILVGEDNWKFFKEIFDDLGSQCQLDVYKKKSYNVPLVYGRLNRWAFREGIHAMLRRNDICFFEWASELLMVASYMPKRCTIVTRLHSFELYDWAPKINWETVDKVILVSQAMQQRFVDLYPAQSHKTEVVYNGRQLDAFTPPLQRNLGFNLGMLCEIAPVKRVYDVILMVYNLKREGYTPHLHIAGEPAGNLRYAAAVYRLIEKLGMQNSVTFYGYVIDTPAWLQQIDIFISNSFWEGQQVALLEAMATGCYCLSHFWDGAEEMLPPENLYITEAGLQQKIIDYYQKSDTERQCYQTQLRSIACEKFDVEKTKVKIRQVLRELE